MHVAFEKAGQKKGLEIWRIENFEPVPYPKKDYGKFYTGDSYIVLHTMESKSRALSWDVHFWLGLETTQDEAGAAAIFTVQLDDALGGAPIQHREVQEHESQLFLNYFKKNGIRYMPGGVASGFNNVEINAAGEKRLFQVKGKKNIRVRQVALSVNSMNKGDCFILDAGDEIFVYVGAKAKRAEKIKAISAAHQIRDQDHNGRASIEIIDEFSSEHDVHNFFKVLGSGSPDEVTDESEDDEAFERSQESETTLYTVSDASGKLTIEPIAQKPLRQEMLNTNDCFILDTGHGIFVWVGKGSTDQEKKQAINHAQEFIKKKNYPTWTKVSRIVEGAETAPFKQYFMSWRDKGTTYSRLIRIANDNDSDTATDEEFDASVLHKLKKSGGRALGFMPDNGEGEAEVFRVENMEIVPIPKENYGFFFGGDSYVIKYEYRNKRGGHGYVIYYWQGLTSSTDEKAASAIHAAKMSSEIGVKSMQVRVVQGFESRHFLKVFKGKIVVLTGGKASGFRNVHDHDSYDVDGTRLFRVRGTCADDVRANQVEEVAKSLASDDVFILETPTNTFVWYGKGANDFEQSMGLSVSKTISPGRDAIVIYEGEEPNEFWDALGGKGDYDHEIDPPGAPFLEPRLFHCSIKTNGKFKVEEVSQFEQDDLDPDDIMVLDGGDEVYVWVGKGSTDEEKAKSIEMANEYIRTDPTERSEETVTIITVQQGGEPRSFKRLFPAWNDHLWEKYVSYEDYRNQVMAANKK
ncbi:hypothetical protein PVAND_001279 [Polypedilum vanderplanki]|uniref:Gelsolin-like domain-containing protein n=1 Tax=Polypedilum vanderplanki TaxID=319348 RepID=A0A9J6BMW4_POLVA|nr:hypothetical protein PVAND_001279 [Polypedilum vanderplanki]